MDKGLVRAFSKYYSQDQIQEIIGERLLGLMGGNFYHILETGCGDGGFTKRIRERFTKARITSLDISERLVNLTKERGLKLNLVVADGEMLPFKKGFDLIISNASFQWFANLETALKGYKNLLLKNGILLFSLFGKNTLFELGASLNELFKEKIKIKAESFPSENEIKEILRRNFKKPFIKKELIKKEYPSIIELLYKIRYSLGINKKILWTPRMIEQLERIYRKKFKKIFATYEAFLCKMEV